MKLTVDFEVFDLNGKAASHKASRFIAEIMMRHKGDNRLKCYELGLKINIGEPIEIDTADLKLIEAAVNMTELYDNLVVGTILKEIEHQKTLANKDKK